MKVRATHVLLRLATARTVTDASALQFGKQIQSQQTPGWGSFYADYKGLKKVSHFHYLPHPLRLSLRPRNSP